jgi:hypothetical protein
MRIVVTCALYAQESRITQKRMSWKRNLLPVQKSNWEWLESWMSFLIYDF